ncbi:pimeloyl-ACP methyl ester carboxylesterase [Lentzea flaviverrucosa]|uniref:Pimeloyl-ACP methyl ester carboxylesterase n=1 Tax=Lentzea flaviverrucosa TaxID=200379 RepID=A0A1H9XSK1_9PSEU|nr:pimeloyl-ACP methyl ester carboxylesterase [Lentzea flaviverrucosa]SES49121.1 Pimeloyl-ACP methyl ester carboxylesterase [Lentzea flaviverrucosa]
MQQSSMKINGQRIAYLDVDSRSGRENARPMVFVHGNSSSAKTWLPVLKGDIGRRFRCLAVDLPGHGQSEPARNHADYSLPGHAAVLTGFADHLGVTDAVFVGWSLGGQIVLEAAPELPEAGGFVLSGAPPVATPAQMAEAFLPNPAMGALFSEHVSGDEAELAAASFTAPGSTLALDEIIADILATDGAARAGLGVSAGAGRFADELAIVAALRQPMAVLHGVEEQLVSLDYLRRLDFPALWRGEVQVIPDAGHTPHLEAPEAFAALLADFMADLADA